ncbi:hypothetical protein Rhopal_005649-T1 [Rhodotorula paludigena]|uniref:Amidohydrolase 3 domain-containing protein n=1 Tax=Rhodotorula paludigena TaxID=86838 RepID=A0AAV5GTQ2_9BASI|nr:hypothetical protein Rhopal_005649-T1 [Rhodotorula paludigena]
MYTSSAPYFCSGSHCLERGAYLAPSVVDSHTHFSSWALAAQRIDLYTALSAAEVLSRMRAWLPIARLHQPDPSLFLVGQRMRVGEWPDLPDMNRLALDALEPDRPLAIFFAGFHSLCANSHALKRLGHEPEGHSGVLEEKECFDAWVEINRISEDSVDAAVAQAAQNAAAQGITEILDLEMAFNIDNWQRRVSKKGIQSLRVRCGMYRDHLPQAIAAGYLTGDIVPETDGLVTVGPHKIITDGSLGSRTACCHHAYPNEPENFGHFEYEVPTLQGMLEKATAAGMSLAVHAIGDRANQLTLETFATLNPPALPGSTIEHAQLLSTEDIPLFKRLGLIASIQPVHMADDRELAEQFWPGRTDRAFPFRTIVDAGIPIRMGSDAPVAQVDPWDAMAVAVSRVGRGLSHLPPWHPEQAISNEQAWLASTSNGKISFAVGDRADLIVIPIDPLTASAEELREMKVKATMLGGRWTHYTL